jgi:hypothetical protein
MKPATMMRVLSAAALIGALAGPALAQGGGGPGPGAGPGPAAAPGAASAPGRAPGMMAPGPRWGADVTPGWTLMTEQERNEHREKMRSLRTYEECKAYRQQHHDQMAARAKERGVASPARPRRDPCAGFGRRSS